jgi:hypothetical protein
MDSAGQAQFTYDRLNRLTRRSAYHHVVGGDKPAAHWTIGEGSGTVASDLSGNGRNGTYQAGVALAQPGALAANSDTAGSFDGVDDSLSVGDDAATRLNGSFTIEFWAKLDTFKNTYPGVIRKGAANTANGYLIYYKPDGTLSFKRNNTELLTTTGALTTAYKHFVVTYDGSTVRWYVNGAENANTARTYPTNAGTDGLVIGQGDQAGDQTMDEVALYNSALSAQQISDHSKPATAGRGSPGTRPATWPA